MQEFIESLWQQEVKQLTIDFCEKGKRHGYINPDLSPEAIFVYFEIFREGVFASPALLADIVQDSKLMRDLTSLVVYGLNG